MTVSFADALTFTLMILGLVLLVCATLYAVAVTLEWAALSVWRATRPRYDAKVLPIARKDRAYPRPKGAA